MKEFQPSEPRSWARIWAGLVVGTLLGASIVPTFTQKLCGNSSWAEAFKHGRDTFWTIGFPTAILDTVIFGIILLGIFLMKKKS